MPATACENAPATMSARYLVRFDDIAPGMNWSVWERVERLLIERDVRPILAVVPDNQHPALEVTERAPDFWDRVRSWQARGWTIGLHGYQHHYETTAAGIVGLNDSSEFADVPRSRQEAKLRAALAIFAAERVNADAWVAPAHSFDRDTIDVLWQLGIKRISDGLFLFPHVDDGGMIWVPQQLWRFRRRPFGVWTVCYHVNGWGDGELMRFARDLEAFTPLITTFDAVCTDYARRRRSTFDSAFAHLYRRYLSVQSAGANVRSRLRGRG